MIPASEIKEGLTQFYGSQSFTRWSKLYPKHILSEGAKFLADSADCYWLMDMIASYHSKCMADNMLRNIQFWTLTVPNNSATLICERDTGDIAITKEIEYTDFPLDSIKLYCAPSGDGIHFSIFLPSEY